MIKGINTHNEFIEIRLKNGWLDITVSKTEFGSKTCIFRREIKREIQKDDMTIDEIMRYFNVIVE